eukprot:TRINITY_DN65616_c0_g1_i1.p1 TRINITY_DN65616_c0_g1~~TRINITY_DN65616_c0_g1_i1.p1  ORF type:complete len:494 (+),score=115.98 TRINITY_DN65616_c0_g1_i1:88-1569(+)
MSQPHAGWPTCRCVRCCAERPMIRPESDIAVCSTASSRPWADATHDPGAPYHRSVFLAIALLSSARRVGAARRLPPNLVSEVAHFLVMNLTWDHREPHYPTAEEGGREVRLTCKLGSGPPAVRATRGFSSGQWYWKTSVCALRDGVTLAIGVCTQHFPGPLSVLMGLQNDGAKLRVVTGDHLAAARGADGGLVFATPSLPPLLFGAGDEVFCALDCSAGVLRWTTSTRPGEWQQLTGLPRATYYPCAVISQCTGLTATPQDLATVRIRGAETFAMGKSVPQLCPMLSLRSAPPTDPVLYGPATATQQELWERMRSVLRLGPGPCKISALDLYSSRRGCPPQETAFELAASALVMTHADGSTIAATPQGSALVNAPWESMCGLKRPGIAHKHIGALLQGSGDAAGAFREAVTYRCPAEVWTANRLPSCSAGKRMLTRVTIVPVADTAPGILAQCPMGTSGFFLGLLETFGEVPDDARASDCWWPQGGAAESGRR